MYTIYIVIYFLTVAGTSSNWVRPYHTEYPLINGDHDCVYHYGGTLNDRGRYLMHYCVRTVKSRIDETLSCNGLNRTFLSLRQSNVTGTDLFNLRAPIDLVSLYEHYLENGEGGEQIWCNCSEHADQLSFGTRCQYRFSINAKSLGDIINQIFVVKYQRDIDTLTDSNFTCYSLYNCTIYSKLCLDWRQVCDGIRNCANGRDEANCSEMEQNECNPDSEYRCRNGMCIPKSFSFDLTMDCLDFYDEQEIHDTSKNCFSDPSLDCEEHACGLSKFSCGDGSCLEHRIETNPTDDTCKNQRNVLYIKEIFAYKKETNLNTDCWLYMWYLLNVSCLFESAIDTIDACKYQPNHESHLSCPTTMFFFPPTHFVFPFVRLLYHPAADIDRVYIHVETPLAVCFNNSYCNIYTNRSFESFFFDGYQCLPLSIFGSSPYITSGNNGLTVATFLVLGVQTLFSHCESNKEMFSQYLFRCPNNLFISYHRCLDQHVDCFPWSIGTRESDEYPLNTCYSNQINYFICKRNDERRCIPRRLLHDGIIDCFNTEDEAFPVGCIDEFSCHYFREFQLQNGLPIIYQELCDGRFSLSWYDGIENDETNCDDWPCTARNIHCNNEWNRRDGCDELNCPHSTTSFIARHVANCSVNEHYCFDYNTTEITCLPLTKAGDRTIDCLFGSDERVFFPTMCRGVTFPMFVPPQSMCSDYIICPLRDDALLCPWRSDMSCSNDDFACKNGTCISRQRRCDGRIDCANAEDEWLCEILNHLLRKLPYRPFSTQGFSLTNNQLTRGLSLTQVLPTFTTSQSVTCHRGLLAYIGNTTETRCFCPPSYYGSRCEHQSERLTVTFYMEIATIRNHQTIYQLVFYLLDGQENVLSVETLIYAPIVHSLKKHVIYLPYPRRMQSLSSFGNMSVRINAYVVTGSTVDFFQSWFYPVQFPFLPVNRLAVHLTTEERRINRTACVQLGCQHGRCMSFVNINRHFCHCDSNWTGLQCDQFLPLLNCSSISASIIFQGHAFCLCPLGRAGPTCRILFNTCSNALCQHDGTCQPLDVRTEEYTCLCKQNYFGDRCQYFNARLLLRIPREIDFVPGLIVHFLHSPDKMPGTLIHRNIYFHKNLQRHTDLLIYDDQQRYLPTLVVAQLLQDPMSPYGMYYFLALIPENKTNLVTSIVSINRCPHVSEYLNSTIMQFEWLKRIKLYHKYLRHVRCYYDEIYMCLVDSKGMSECLHFNHHLTNCTDRNYCENRGRCLQKKRLGQLNFMCICPDCIGGDFCQIQMTQFSLTLDSILSQTTVTDAPLSQQPILVKILIVLIVIIFLLGMISNVLSSFTFASGSIRQIGSGNYLFILSNLSFITLVILMIQFFTMLVNQITIIENKRLLNINCILFDLILKVATCLCDYLTACVAVERTLSVIKGVTFSREISVRAVKFVVPILFVFLVLSFLYQPLSRVLIVDPRNEERFWCVMQFHYGWLQIYDIIINLVNTIGPFVINLICAIILLITFAHTKRSINTKQLYWQLLMKQVRQHKDLIISPLLMIAFKLPLLIIMFVIRCAKSDWQIKMSIIAYILSLLPLMATFTVFIIPSDSYLKIFHERKSKLYKSNMTRT